MTTSVRTSGLPRTVAVALRWCVGLGTLGVLLTRVDARTAAQTLAGIPPVMLASLAAIAGFWLLLGALNLRLLLGDAAPGARVFVGVYLLGWLAASFLPGQLGDALQLPLLRRHGLPLARGGAAYVVDKSVSLVWSIAMAATGALVYLPRATRARALLLLAAGVVVLLLVVAAVLQLPLGRHSAGQRLRGLLVRSRAELVALARHPYWIARDFVITVARWALTTALYTLGFAACGVHAPLLATATLPMLASLVGYVPITVGGLGTMEWMAVALFSTVGAPAATVVAVYLLLRGVLLVVAGAGAVALLPVTMGRPH